MSKLQQLLDAIDAFEAEAEAGTKSGATGVVVTPDGQHRPLITPSPIPRGWSWDEIDDDDDPTVEWVAMS